MLFNPYFTFADMRQLKQVLVQDDTVLFVGSGASAWSGLPSWSALIEELAVFVEEAGANADLIRNEARRGDLLQAASYGFHKLTKQQVGDFVRAACRYGVAKPHEIHRKLVTLGPRCFVTTNYDNLIEEGLRLWQSERFVGTPITNRHLTETAGIVQACAKDFVFKPHGDAGDSESIILTREQYRLLLPGGERQAALESVKMLLASRPVVYVGFGLRDPDFMYVRDLLANTYKGGTRDHYAILADISEAEIDYWRSSYGIHLVGYVTNTLANGQRDHSPLLQLLDEIQPVSQPTAAVSAGTLATSTCTPETVLALARHAGKLSRIPKIDPEFPIRVHEENSPRLKRESFRANRFEHCPVEQFLDEGPRRAVLIGLPGAGKSYALRRAAARMADRLHEACLAEKFDEPSAPIPMWADLKLYRGNVHDLVSQSLPSGLSLDTLTRCCKVKIFLDSFNEMPREHWEHSSYEADFAEFVTRIGDASLIIGSRTSDGLAKLAFPCFCLDEIEKEYVEKEIIRQNVEVGQRFDRELRSLLRKPFYFHLVTSRAISLPKEAQPKDIFRSYFTALSASFEERFGKRFNLEYALSRCAFEAINQGQEAQSLTDVLQVLKTQLQVESILDVQPLDIANWLVSKDVFVPYIGGRIAFFHQAATEYLAAVELARRYQSSADCLQSALRLTRWDQALFLTLSLLPPDKSKTFLDAVVEVDFCLALRAVKYLESGRDDVVARLLTILPRAGYKSCFC
jgi:hypothetical protein